MTWTPVTPQSEAWTEQTQAARVFDPYVFDRDPIYDTGSTAGVWDARSEQQETWTAA
jgi:hypothetical protein